MFIEQQIQNLQRRIKNIEQNPRPEYLKSNKLLYEIELENMLHVKEAWQAGKPFAWLGHVGGALNRALGFEHHVGGGNRITDPQRYFDLLVSKFGFPEHSCDQAMMMLALPLSGEVPLPRLVVGSRNACDPERWAAMGFAKFAGALFFEVSKLSSNDYEGLHYAAEQFGELIEFAEKSIPGIKYDEDRLIETLEIEQQAYSYYRESYDLRKMVPCPLSSQDCFRLAVMPQANYNPGKVLDYCKMYRDELFERAEKGIGGVPEEKLRIAWLCTAPFGRSTFDLLTQKGVSMVWFHYGVAAHNFGVLHTDYGDNLYGQKLTPLEELARLRHWATNSWGGTSEDWVDPLVKVCRELKVDAVVDFLQVGCITTKNLKRITAQRLQEELSIPTLDLEGRQRFTTEAGTIEMNKKLEEFLDLCIDNKK
ncbi:MAG: Benzoyl-CoA reductase/2-hydroxyglutaryl-CoA dehydratase subunit, BcrC/BadD/HgdB [Dehalococcoidales bacterium]|nr:Benzoyl-CoA reductase/2-hydroxyglutaryl-CoA dehydratase subunit, BcrC/BadD/HgdB [Dehalococcoidales bacterium]